MNKQDYCLITKDLLPRLFYGVKANILHVDGDNRDCVVSFDDVKDFANGDITIIPYLRPMGDMTKEEYQEYLKLAHYTGAGVLTTEHGEKSVWVPSFEKIDWLNSHHFDYRGLIEKGLVFKAPEDMYNLKTNENYEKGRIAKGSDLQHKG